MADEAVETLKHKAESTTEGAKVQAGINGSVGVEQKRHNFLVEALRRLVRRKGPETEESSGKPIVDTKEAAVSGFIDETEPKSSVDGKAFVGTTKQAPEGTEKAPRNLRDAMDARLAEWHTRINKEIIENDQREKETKDYIAAGETRAERIGRRMDTIHERNLELPTPLLESANHAMSRLRLLVKPK